MQGKSWVWAHKLATLPICYIPNQGGRTACRARCYTGWVQILVSCDMGKLFHLFSVHFLYVSQ